MTGARGRRDWHSIAAGALPAIVIALGCWWLVALVVAVPDEVFFSGDGGLKALMARQLLAGHWVPWLELNEPAWVRQLWDTGMYPFRPPFAYELDGQWYSSFEWTFPALSVPGYAVAGFRGLYFVPVLALLATWLRLASLLRALNVGVVGTTLSLAVLVFATPLSLHAGVFWEHAPAAALAFAGFADMLLLQIDARRPRALRAGVLLGLACWLRPEAVVFGAASLAVHAFGKRRRLAVMAGISFAIVLGAQLAFNRASYGEWLGVHAIQVVEGGRDPAVRIDAAIEVARSLRDRWLRDIPFTWMAVFLAGLTVAARGPAGAAAQRSIGVVLLAFAGISLLVPNSGGLQIGPRYLLLLVPILALLTGLGAQHARRVPGLTRWPLLVLAAGIVVISAQHNVTTESERIRNHYVTRILPAIHAIERRPHAGILFGHHWAAMEMTTVIGDRPIVTVEHLREIDRAVEAMMERGHDVLLVDGPFDRRFAIAGTRRHGSVMVEWTVISEQGEYFVVHGVRARPAP